MIDLLKLKRAFDLCNQYAMNNRTRCDLTISYEYDEIGEAYILITEYENWYTDNIDCAIERLIEINKCNAKFSIGQKVWQMASDNKTMIDVCIDEIRYSPDGFEYLSHGHGIGQTWRHEDNFFESKEDLIKDQVHYWNTLLANLDNSMPFKLREKVLVKGVVCTEDGVYRMESISNN